MARVVAKVVVWVEVKGGDGEGEPVMLMGTSGDLPWTCGLTATAR